MASTIKQGDTRTQADAVPVGAVGVLERLEPKSHLSGGVGLRGGRWGSQDACGRSRVLRHGLTSIKKAIIMATEGREEVSEGNDQILYGEREARTRNVEVPRLGDVDEGLRGKGSVVSAKASGKRGEGTADLKGNLLGLSDTVLAHAVNGHFLLFGGCG